MAATRVANAGYEHHVGHLRRAGATWYSKVVGRIGQGAVPRAIVHAHRIALGKGQTDTHRSKARVSDNPLWCVELILNRPIQAQTARFKLGQYFDQIGGQSLAYIGYSGGEKFGPTPQQAGAQHSACQRGICRVASAFLRSRLFEYMTRMHIFSPPLTASLRPLPRAIARPGLRQIARAVKAVYERIGLARRFVLGAALSCSVGVLLASLPLEKASAEAASATDATILEAKEAFTKRDAVRLAQTRALALAGGHPLAAWADYWHLNLSLPKAEQADLTAFYARWPGSYQEDRLRNDWLLELGHRRDWERFSQEMPRFRMSDDREVTCYALWAQHAAGKPVRDAALAAWLAQRDADEGCAGLASALFEAQVFTSADVWRKLRTAVDANKPRALRQAAALLGPTVAAAAIEAFERPAKLLTRPPTVAARPRAELLTLALGRMANSDPETTSGQLIARWEAALPADLASWAWAVVAKQSAFRLLPEASTQFQRAELLASQAADTPGAKSDGALDWPDDALAWKARAALRGTAGQPRWQQVVQAINAMPSADQREPSWVYWKARALNAVAASSQDADSMRAQARAALASLVGGTHFYAKLAAEDLGQPVLRFARPPPISAAERDAATAHPGLTRALAMLALGLRSEGVKEWNFSLRGMSDRELLAAAQRACDLAVWDRCINTSDRTRVEVDMAQRFVAPFRSDVQTQANAVGIDPAYAYGLIRQESRFVTDARSHVGASGLMQLMPATARWTARKIGLPYHPGKVTDLQTNLALGAGYLKLLLDNFGGSQVLAAAAYNAGPSRSRRWREGPVLESAIWVENIPFNETRDYVKKVLSNAVDYANVLGQGSTSIRARLGPFIGPQEPGSPALDKDLP